MVTDEDGRCPHCGTHHMGGVCAAPDAPPATAGDCDDPCDWCLGSLADIDERDLVITESGEVFCSTDCRDDWEQAARDDEGPDV